MSRFLLAPFAPQRYLAHLGTALAVSEQLRARGHEAVIAYGGRLPELIERSGAPWRPVPETAEVGEPGSNHFAWFETVEDLIEAVEVRRELIDDVRPDVVVHDTSFPTAIACEKQGVPDLFLMHFLLGTPHARAHDDVWRQRLDDVMHPRRAAAVLRAKLRPPPGDWRRQLDVIAECRRRLGLPALPPVRRSVENMLTGSLTAAAVACTTTPFLVPADLPAHWRYVGPVHWSAPAPVPTPPSGDRPVVYLTQGSTGDPEFLRQAVRELGDEPVDVIATTGGLCDPQELERLAENVSAAAYLDGDACLGLADVAVIHGGQLTATAAHRHGVPVVVAPAAYDQSYWAQRAERLGSGIGLWPRPRPGEIAPAVRRILNDPAYRRHAEEIGDRLRGEWDGARNIAGMAEELAAGSSTPAAPAEAAG